MGTKDPRDSLTRWGDESVDLAVRRGRDALKEKIGSEVAQLSGISGWGKGESKGLLPGSKNGDQDGLRMRKLVLRLVHGVVVDGKQNCSKDGAEWWRAAIQEVSALLLPAIGFSQKGVAARVHSFWQMGGQETAAL